MEYIKTNSAELVKLTFLRKIPYIIINPFKAWIPWFSTEGYEGWQLYESDEKLYSKEELSEMGYIIKAGSLYKKPHVIYGIGNETYRRIFETDNEALEFFKYITTP